MPLSIHQLLPTLDPSCDHGSASAAWSYPCVPTLHTLYQSSCSLPLSLAGPLARSEWDGESGRLPIALLSPLLGPGCSSLQQATCCPTQLQQQAGPQGMDALGTRGSKHLGNAWPRLGNMGNAFKQLLLEARSKAIPVLAAMGLLSAHGFGQHCLYTASACCTLQMLGGAEAAWHGLSWEQGTPCTHPASLPPA